MKTPITIIAPDSYDSIFFYHAFDCKVIRCKKYTLRRYNSSTTIFMSTSYNTLNFIILIRREVTQLNAYFEYNNYCITTNHP